MSKRLAGRHGYPEAPRNFDVTWHEDKLEQPTRWRKPRKIFVCSMSDLFHEDVSFEQIALVFRTMYCSTWHTYQILTKRPERALEFFAKWDELDHKTCVREVYTHFYSHVWFGVTAENQEMADKRIPILLRIPAAVYFVSIEPMLEKMNVSWYLRSCPVTHEYTDGSVSKKIVPALDQVIAGAETGPGARPMDLDWARSVRDQCQAAGVPFFFKRDSKGNRELDGRLWEEFPR